MRPLKVTACLCSPLAGDPPQLDALLEWVMSLRLRSVWESRNGARHATGLPKYRGEAVVPGAIPIPLQRDRVLGFPHPIARCSSPIMPRPQWEGVEYYAKRLAVEEADLLHESQRVQVNTTGGEHKSYRLPLRIRLIDRVVWFCAGRDKSDSHRSPGKEVRALLRRVPAIGKKTEYGYGRVSRWEIEPTDEDWSWFAPREDGSMVLMRALPVANPMPKLAGARRAYAAVCAPYWLRGTMAEAVVPC